MNKQYTKGFLEAEVVGFTELESVRQVDALITQNVTFCSISGKAHTEGGSARMSLLILVSIFLSAAFVMFLVYKNFPQLSE